MGARSFPVLLDPTAYTAKPTAEVAAITRRLQQGGATTIDAADFCEAVRRGQTWVGGVYEPSRNGWGEFVGQQLFALDCDNDTVLRYRGERVVDAGNHTVKRPLRPGEVGYLDPHQALTRCEALGIDPLCLYFTASDQSPTWPRFRLVFDLGELLDADAAQAVAESLLLAFPEADQSCRNPNRLFFGSNGLVWELWRAWSDAS